MGKNIVLIGMPGVGKSTIGVILAKEIGYQFVDADLVIQEREQRLLRKIQEEDGIHRFLEIENEINMSIGGQNQVVATGGSAVYGKEAMDHYRKEALIVYLRSPYQVLFKRLKDLKGRGVVLKEGQTLLDIYEERDPLYEKYAHIIVDEENHDIEETLEMVLEHIKNC